MPENQQRSVYVRFTCDIAPDTGPFIDVPLGSNGKYLSTNLLQLRQSAQKIVNSCSACTQVCTIKQFANNKI